MNSQITMLVQSLSNSVAIRSAFFSLVLGLFGTDAGRADTVTFSIADVTVRAGEQVAIPIVVKGAKGMSAMQALLTYDPNVLELSGESADVIRGEIVPNNAILQAQTTVAGRLPILFVGGADVESKQVSAVQQDGTLVTIRFKVIGAAGQKTQLGLEGAEAFQVNDMDMLVETKSGALTIQSTFPWWWVAIAAAGLFVLLLIVRSTRSKNRQTKVGRPQREEGELVAVAEDDSMKHTCIGCGRSMTIPSSLIGKKFKCPNCGTSQSSPGHAASQNLRSVESKPLDSIDPVRMMHSPSALPGPELRPASFSDNRRNVGNYLLLGMAGFGVVCLVAIAAAAATAFFLTRSEQWNVANKENSNPGQTPVGELATLTKSQKPLSSLASPQSLASPERVVSPARQPLQPVSERDSGPSVWNEVSQVAEFSADDLIRQGRQLLADQQPQQAAELLRRAVKLNSQHFAGQMNLGHAMWQMKNYQGAIQAYGRATRLDPQNGFAVFCLASSSALAGQLDNSVAQFERAIEVNPSLPEAFNGLGEVLYARFLANTWRGINSRQDLTRAVYCFFRAKGLAPDERRYSDNLSWVDGILTNTERQLVGRDLMLNRLPWAKN